MTPTTARPRAHRATSARLRARQQPPDEPDERDERRSGHDTRDSYDEGVPRPPVAGQRKPTWPCRFLFPHAETQGSREGVMAARSPEARKVLRDLNKELASAGTRQGRTLVWSASEATVLRQVETILDRKRDFMRGVRGMPTRSRCG